MQLNTNFGSSVNIYIGLKFFNSKDKSRQFFEVLYCLDPVSFLLHIKAGLFLGH